MTPRFRCAWRLRTSCIMAQAASSLMLCFCSERGERGAEDKHRTLELKEKWMSRRRCPAFVT